MTRPIACSAGTVTVCASSAAVTSSTRPAPILGAGGRTMRRRRARTGSRILRCGVALEKRPHSGVAQTSRAATPPDPEDRGQRALPDRRALQTRKLGGRSWNPGFLVRRSGDALEFGGDRRRAARIISAMLVICGIGAAIWLITDSTTAGFVVSVLGTAAAIATLVVSDSRSKEGGVIAKDGRSGRPGQLNVGVGGIHTGDRGVR